MSREKCLLVIYGEVVLRGRNRNLLIRQMKKDIERRFPEESGYYADTEHGRILIRRETGDFDHGYAVEKVKAVFGILYVCPGVLTEDRSLANIQKIAVEIMADKKGSFKVETNRGDKNYPMKSPEISREVGAAIQRAYGEPVSMTENEHTLYVDLRTKVYIYTEMIPGLGGLPRNSTGKALALLSGGIDSPVAIFLMAKRGIEMSGVYFHSPPFTSERALLKVKDLAKQLAYYTENFTLYIVDFTETQLLLKEHVPLKGLTIHLKRSMLSIGEKIATAKKIEALVTGDNVGQVASQTMLSLQASDLATDMMVIRPLAIFDKQEIINIGKKIGTYDISIRPYEDCCTLFVADSPETKPNRYIIEKASRRVPGLDAVEEKAYLNMQTEIITY